jgi:hypothetical protein
MKSPNIMNAEKRGLPYRRPEYQGRNGNGGMTLAGR